jgi:hypothetical protein
MATRITFFDKDKPYYEFSNFAPFPIVFDDHTWQTTEHYYQAQKFNQPNNPRSMEYYNIISQADSPMKIFLLANKRHAAGYQTAWLVNKRTMRETINEVIDRYPDVTIRPDWEQVKVSEMRRALRAKFDRIYRPGLCDMLLSTGNLEIVEANPRDSFWGAGPDGTGQNKLGNLLMELRAQLRQ